MTTHPFITAARTLFNQHGWPYDLTQDGMVASVAEPLRHSVTFVEGEARVAVLASLHATIPQRHAVDALILTNNFNREFFVPQAYLTPIDNGLHPAATVSMPVVSFDAKRATETVTAFICDIGTWIQWWAQHTDPLELSPIEQWRLAGVNSPWADILVEAGFLPEDANGIDDIEAFASELLLEHCSTTVQAPNT